MRRQRGAMRLVHIGAEQVTHPEDRTHGEHACRDAQYGQQRARFIVPDIEPDLVPEDAHLKPALSEILAAPAALRGARDWGGTATRGFPARVDPLPDEAP